MNTEELLKPRYKVIADWPFSPFEIGEILNGHEGKFFIYDDTGRYPINPAAYPAVFKKLSWWEERKPEDMPEYLKHNNAVFKVKEYGWFKGGNSAKFEDGTTEYLARSEPATLEGKN